MISYVIPTLNSSKTLDMTLMSLRSQENINVNIIVVDSGSTDSTLEICKRWDVPTLYAEPGNMYRAINMGLRQFQTEWLGYINSDDWLYPDSLSRLTAYGDALNADIVYGNCDYTDESGRFVYSLKAAKESQLIPLFRLKIMGFAQPATIFRNQLYQQLNGFNEDYFLCSDAEFFLRSLNLGAQFVSLDEPSVACFRIHQKQLTNSKSNVMEQEKHTISSELAGSSSIYDLIVKMQWQLTNMPYYLMRLLRQSLLSGRIKLTKSMVPLNYSDTI